MIVPRLPPERGEMVRILVCEPGMPVRIVVNCPVSVGVDNPDLMLTLMLADAPAETTAETAPETPAENDGKGLFVGVLRLDTDDGKLDVMLVLLADAPAESTTETAPETPSETDGKRLFVKVVRLDNENDGNPVDAML